MYKRQGAVNKPMPKKQLQRISKAFKRRGGIIQMNAETDAYLDVKKAEAITYDAKTILLRQHPSRSAVFEELIHATQFRHGKNDWSKAVSYTHLDVYKRQEGNTISMPARSICNKFGENSRESRN